MKYRIEEYKLKNGIEDISIIFDEKYQLLTTFMSCDVLPFEKWIKSGFDRVLSGKSEYEEVNGNVCCAEISPKTFWLVTIPATSWNAPASCGRVTTVPPTGISPMPPLTVNVITSAPYIPRVMAMQGAPTLADAENALLI